MNIKRMLPVFVLIVGCGILGCLLLTLSTYPSSAKRTDILSAHREHTMDIHTTGLTADEPPPDGQPRRSIEREEQPNTWKSGGTLQNGKFVLLNWRPDSMGDPGSGCAYLLSDYGFVLLNEGTYSHPKVVYLLGFLKEKRVDAYRSFKAFQSALKKLPRGSKVYRHDICTSGTAPGIGETTVANVNRAFRKAHLIFNDEKSVRYCLCGPELPPNCPEELEPTVVRLYGKTSLQRSVGAIAEKPVD